MTGYLFNGSTDFGGKVVKVAGPNDGDFFIAKFSSGGEVQWVQIGYGYGGLALDRKDNIFFNGYVAGDYAMHCGAFTPTGAVIWERRIPGTHGAGVALTAAGHPVFVGEFEGTVHLDGHTIEAVAGTNQKFFIGSAGADGRFRWAIGDSGLTQSRAWRVVTSDDGRIFVAGDVSCFWSDGHICEPGQLDSFALPPPQAGAGTDLFLARIDEPTARATELRIARISSDFVLSWPVEATDYILEAATSLPAVSWTPVTNTPTVTTTERSVRLPLTGNAIFFRLRRR